MSCTPLARMWGLESLSMCLPSVLPFPGTGAGEIPDHDSHVLRFAVLRDQSLEFKSHGCQVFFFSFKPKRYVDQVVGCGCCL